MPTATLTDDSPATRCAWCDAPLPEREGRLPGRAVCGRCGAATTDPWPSQRTLAEAYGGWYRPASGRFSGLGDAILRRSRGSLARRLDRIAPPGPVLDVGAGDGALIAALEARGRIADGVEREPTAPGIRFTDIAEARGEYAAVVFWHSLEHLPAPSAALERAAALLAAGGVAAVAVPNSDSLQARVFGDRWLALDIPRHLVHLPAKTLLESLDSLGLQVTRTSYLRGGQVMFGWLHGLVGSLPGRPNLYDAIRRAEARSRPLSARRRRLTLAAAVALAPAAVAATALEVALRRGGTVYVEAVRG